MHLAAPRLARRLRPEAARFLSGELHTDLPEGSRRELDLVAEVPPRDEQADYERLRDRDDDVEVREMEMTWAERMEKEYTERGLERGLERGREQGRIDGMHRLVLHLAERRWGGLGEPARRRVEAIDSAEALESLADRLLTARSPEEAGLA